MTHLSRGDAGSGGSRSPLIEPGAVDVAAYLTEKGALVDAFLDERLPAADSGPGKLHEAIRYCVFARGKRFRPALAIATCEAFHGRTEAVLPAAAAIELIHVSSLVHDDLPCMDDADLRRGKPSCHRAYGEALAVLVGDWLLAFPFEILSCPSMGALLRPEQCCITGQEIARSVCSSGIVAGQVADLEAERRQIGLDELQRLHVHKTGALIRAAVRCGLVAAGVPFADLDAHARFAEQLGLAFQVADDILDVTADEATLGKPVGADNANNKSTYVSLLGLDGARRVAEETAAQAHALLTELPPGSDPSVLHALVDFVVGRGS